MRLFVAIIFIVTYLFTFGPWTVGGGINGSSLPLNDASQGSGMMPDNAISRSEPPIRIFYNLFVKGPKDANRVLGIFLEQFLAMDPELHDVANLSVNSVGYLPPEIPYQYIAGHHLEGGEDGALRSLWEYCRVNDNPKTKVVYLHSKGSFHPGGDNDRLRRFLTEGALSKECASLPDGCNVCSSRMSPHPHPHTSGNMWLARCDYVTRLRNPYDLKEGRLPGVFQGGTPDDGCWGYGRYFFEHWVHSHPSVRPCDLYPGSDHVWGYSNVPNIPFKKEIQLSPRFGFDEFAKHIVGSPHCRLWRGGTKEGYLEARRAGYKHLYNINLEELNETTWYLWKFLDLNPPL